MEERNVIMCVFQLKTNNISKTMKDTAKVTINQ